jgi:alpha-L-rhamnosidase
MKLYVLCIFITILTSSFTHKEDGIAVQHLRCEMLENPEGINVAQPHISWEIISDKRDVQQTAYQVLVASSKELLQEDKGDLWNSGIVHSSKSIQVQYNGVKSTSTRPCWWKVKVFTNKGKSSWSEAAYWSMGLLNSNDWKAKWIGYDGAFEWDSVTKFSRLSARYFRKEFNCRAHIKRASIYVAGLGLYELFINGQKVGDRVLTPAPTDYRKSVLYNTYDVTNGLKEGKNAIGVVVGNGQFFTMRQQYKPYKINTFDYPKLLLQLLIEYDKGQEIIVSDGSWKMTANGPIRSNNEYDGEEYDASKEMPGWNKVGFNDRDWMTPKLVSAPAGKLTAQMNEGMKVMQHIQPVNIAEIRSHHFIVDMGQNFAGNVSIIMQAKKGDSVQLRFAESLNEDGSLYTANLRDAKATDVYITKDGRQSWQPAFVFHGFRYVEVSNYPGALRKEDIVGNDIYDDLRMTGNFTTSDTIINHIYQNAWWGISSNYKGMPIDCPQRNERMPWLGDRTIGSLGESFVFDNAKLYAKWLNDIEQAQTSEGAIPDVAPAFWNYYSDDVTWPAAYFTVADMLYRQFGDTHAIAAHYTSMQQWMQYMQQRYLRNNLMIKDKYGDWCVPPESKELIHAKDSTRITDGKLIATAYYYHLLQLMQQFAVVLNKNKDVNDYALLAGKVKAAFNDSFYHQKDHYYGNNTVTANLLPLYFDMVPEKQGQEVFNHIITSIVEKNKTHISTGVIGTQWLMRTLTNYSRADLAYQLASNTTYPSLGYMVKNGASTIWELWNGNTANPQMNSQNHVMLLGDLITWMYEDAAGIKSSDTAVAFKQIIMQPAVTDKLDYVNASYHSMYGIIKSEWKKEAHQFTWNITVPANTSAMVYIPATSSNNITESSQLAAKCEGVEFVGMKNNRAVYKVASGTYSFISNL